jgi:hypothetical protein
MAGIQQNTAVGRRQSSIDIYVAPAADLEVPPNRRHRTVDVGVSERG